MAEPKPSKTVFQFPPTKPTWLENIAVRQNGTILTTALHAPELWTIDPTTGKGEIAVSFPEPVRSVIGIAELSHDLFAVGAAEWEVMTDPFTPGSWSIWIVDFNNKAGTAVGLPPAPKFIAHGPKKGLCNGLARLDDHTVLIADSILGLVYKLDISTPAAECFQAYTDEEMTSPPGAFAPIGVNGIKVRGDYFYFTNTTRGAFYRRPLAGAGPVQELASGFPPDDFAFDVDGTAYITTHAAHTVVKVSPDTGKEVVTVSGGLDRLDVAGSTSCAFIRDEGKKRLYVSTCGALSAPVNGTETEPAKVTVIEIDG